jgi:hypothetical protein
VRPSQGPHAETRNKGRPLAYKITRICQYPHIIQSGPERRVLLGFGFVEDIGLWTHIRSVIPKILPNWVIAICSFQYHLELRRY